MRNDVYNKTVLATATNTSKSENQDDKGEFEGTHFNSLFIADGLGSFIYPRLASARVVDFFKASAKNLNDVQAKSYHPNFNEFFKQAKEKLIGFANENMKAEDKETQNLYGTTAITVFETEDKIHVSYVGNGGVWHIRGNFNDFPAAYHYPWNAVNYLNPHTTSEDGKEALYRLISNSSDFTECVPTSIEIEKDKSVGEILMICTDGIYSADQVKAGKNDKGVWVRYEPSMLKFFEYLKEFFKANQYYSKELVEQMLNKYLEELKPTLDDDATIGIIITKEALNYQNKINWLEKNEDNTNNQI
jgi:serine/threonine protein phosphatase PrpC